ncbi:hypothetical protein NQ318_010375 [Aromia moschata]|uniref:PIH1 N-terminal domain-containing protein n=1 Tax=Aromia moschata TaxID=1265417 RepID=A0AAV8XBE0_9CUCU|nr:hypothetical protein NQ318_010375 [Aromia moschata]
MLTDYVEELQDPKNKKLYEDEITQLEKERGVDVTFIHPKPGYVIKTSVNGNKKAFINICANDHIKKPTSSPTIKEGTKDTLHLAEKNKAFRTMVNTTALEAVETSFDVKLDKKNLRFPKLSYKGLAHA